MEETIQVRFVAWMKSRHPDVLLARINNNTRGGVGMGKRSKNLGTKAGMPDLLLFKKFGDFVGVALELKRDREWNPQVRPEQLECLATLRAEGWFSVVAYGLEEAQIAVEHYMVKRDEAKVEVSRRELIAKFIEKLKA